MLYIQAREKDEASCSKRGVDGAVASENDLAETSVKDEPLSPTSSISSRVSESGSKRGHRTRGRPEGFVLSFTSANIKGAMCLRLIS